MISCWGIIISDMQILLLHIKRWNRMDWNACTLLRILGHAVGFTLSSQRTLLGLIITYYELGICSRPHPAFFYGCKLWRKINNIGVGMLPVGLDLGANNEGNCLVCRVCVDTPVMRFITVLFYIARRDFTSMAMSSNIYLHPFNSRDRK